MKFNKWTLALAAAGVVSLASVAQAEEQHQVMTALSQTTLSGYVDTSAMWKIGSPNGALPGRTFDNADKLDGFNLHAVKLTLEKPLDEGQWSAGYKTDLIFGPDANYYSTLLNQTAGFNADDFAVKQAYVALRAPIGNGLDIKLGVWDTLVGYEVFESGNNPNFSRSFGYSLEPTHHTGVLLSYHVNEALSVSGGVANGWTGPVNDKIHFNNASDQAHKAVVGSVTLTLPEAAGPLAGSSLYLGVVHGESTSQVVFANAGLNPETTSYYAGTTITTPLEGLSLGAAFDWRQDGVGTAPFTVGGPMALSHDAWATALYASFQATEKFRVNARADYTRASDGTYFDGGTRGVSDERNELGSLTFTADYSLWANVITRGEVRWDHAFNGERPYGGNDRDKDAVTLAANFIYKF
ncbi:MAG: outer membrane beta-barrel protein [Verrucomicrobiales bacterium]